MALESPYHRYLTRRLSDVKGQEHLFLVLSLLVATLMLAGTDLVFGHVLWVMSLCCQASLGTNLAKFLSPVDQKSDSATLLAGVSAGFFVYSCLYQLLLYTTSDVRVTWLTANLVVAGTALFLSRQRQVTPSNQTVNHYRFVKNDTSSWVAMILGGGLLIVGLSEMRSLMWLGMGLLLVESLRVSRESELSSRQRVPLSIVGVSFCISAVMAWTLDRPFGRFWFVSSNDFQTSVALAVSTSRFGFWDQARFAGTRDTYHWGVYGWAGMTGPVGDYVVQVVVMTPIVVAGLLFGAGVVCIETMVRATSLGAKRHQAIIAALMSSMFLASGFSSYTTQFGMFSVVTFSLLLRNFSPATKGKWYVLLSLVLLSAVWSNALAIVFLVVVIGIDLFAGLCLYKNQTNVGKRRYASLTLAMTLLGAGAWCLLYLPAARGGSFVFAPLQERDQLFPYMAEALQFVGSKGRALFFELVSNQSLLLSSFVMGVVWKLSRRNVRHLFQGSTAIGVCSIIGLLLLRGYEIGKFAQWGSFATLVVVGALLILALQRVAHQSRRDQTVAVVVLAVVVLVLFTFGILYSVGPYFGVLKVEMLIVVPTVTVGFGFVLRKLLMRLRMQGLSAIALTVSSVFSFQLGQISGRYAMETRQRYDMATSQNDVFYEAMVTDSDVESVADFIADNTPENSLLASNYFCRDGATCPSKTLLEVERSDLTPSIWGQHADMSNLAALSQRRFLILAPRHVFGNYSMPAEAQERFRLSGEFALSRVGEGRLRQLGVDFFVLDWDSVAPKPRVEIPGTVYRNSRFSVISFNAD